MVELLFVVCISTAPDQCRERSLLFTEISPSQCAMGAQPELAKWVATHPEEQIKSWRCRSVSFAEQDA